MKIMAHDCGTYFFLNKSTPAGPGADFSQAASIMTNIAVFTLVSDGVMLFSRIPQTHSTYLTETLSVRNGLLNHYYCNTFIREIIRACAFYILP